MIVLDIETSGVDPHKNSIISIGALDFNAPQNQFYDECRVWDGAHINDDSLAVNGFTREEITDPTKKTEKEVVRALLSWAADIRDWTILGQNPSFDRDFLKAACARAHMDFTLAHRTIDTHTLAYMHMIKRGTMPPFDAAKHRTALNLETIAQYVGIPEEPKPHNAMTGALIHAEVASRLLYDRPLIDDFSVYPIPWTIPRIG